MNPGEPQPDKSLIEYPCAFPIKVMGLNVDGFTEAIVSIVRQFDPDFDASTLVARPSKAQNYVGLTVTVKAISRDQLDELYRTLSTHPMVRYVL